MVRVYSFTIQKCIFAPLHEALHPLWYIVLLYKSAYFCMTRVYTLILTLSVGFQSFFQVDA